MGDLISKNALKKALSEKYSGLADARDEEQFALYSVYKQIVRVIEAQPTAYDVEKVVGRLKLNALPVEKEDEHIVPESNVIETFEMFMVELNTAIDIVRNGGKE